MGNQSSNSSKWNLKRLFGIDTPKKKNKKSDIENNQGKVITEATAITNILSQAVDIKTPLEIQFGLKILTFNTQLEKEIPPYGKNNSDTPSNNYIFSKKHIRIGIIDPPEGNKKIEVAHFAIASFMLNHAIYEFKTFAIEMPEDLKKRNPPGFHLAFPEALYSKKQKRRTTRAPVPIAAKVQLFIGRMSGSEFEAQLMDISVGGFSFFMPEETAHLMEGTELTVHMVWPEQQSLTLKGQLLRATHKGGKASCQAKFVGITYEETRDLGELVTYIQRKALKEKADRFIGITRRNI